VPLRHVKTFRDSAVIDLPRHREIDSFCGFSNLFGGGYGSMTVDLDAITKSAAGNEFIVPVAGDYSSPGRQSSNPSSSIALPA
jgi:hypothetical protein